MILIARNGEIAYEQALGFEDPASAMPMTIDSYLKQRILAPLKMHEPGFSVEPSQQHWIAELFATDPDSAKPAGLLDVKSQPDFLSGSGGMVSTLQNICALPRCY